MIASKCHSVGGSVVAEVSRVKGEHWGALGHRREGPLCATHGGNQLHTRCKVSVGSVKFTC